MGYVIWVIIKILGFMLRPFKKRKNDNKIYCMLIAYSGENNTGSEARAIEALKQIQGASEKEFVFYLNTFDIESTKRYMEEIKNLNLLTPEKGFLRLFSKMISILLYCDLAVLIEGSGLRQNFADILLWHFTFSLGIAKELGVKTATYAIDAGKVTRANKYLTRKVANKIDLLITRNEESAQYLRSIDVKNKILVTADTAFSLVSKNGSWHDNLYKKLGINKTKPMIGIAFKEFFWWPVTIRFIKYLKGEKDNQFNRFLYHTWNPGLELQSRTFLKHCVEAVKHIKQKYDAEILLIAMENMDRPACEDFNRLLGNHIPIFSSNEYNAPEMSAILRSLDFLITTRYHAFVLSMEAAVPTIAVSHDERLYFIMKELDFIEKYYFNYDDYHPDILRDKLINSFDGLYLNRAVVSETIKSANARYIEKSGLNGEHFKSFLTACKI